MLNKNEDKNLDILFDFDSLFPFNWDKKSYKFNRDEKDMHPYSIIEKEKEVLITHNILGIDKKDLKISIDNDDKNTYILIKGKTKDSITNKEYSIDSRFVLDEKNLELNNIIASERNGLLYITIPKKEKQNKTYKNIEII